MTPTTTPAAAEGASAPPSHDPVDVERYRTVRAFTERLAEPLSTEDACVQSMPDASPAKWHLAHTTWFFETFVLAGRGAGYEPFDPAFAVMFNSYYNAVGEQHPRPRRGLLTRPGLDRVRAYRRHVDAAMHARLETGDLTEQALWVVDVGLHHEQQHQELLLMDIRHLLSCNPTDPAYLEGPALPEGDRGPDGWVSFDGGVRAIGHEGGRFAYDNEGPRHEVLVRGFDLACRPVTHGEYAAFIEDGGYRRPELWMADGWTRVREAGWQAPHGWSRRDGAWTVFGLRGRESLPSDAPVCHVSFYEADAYARWSGARLPTEAEWEVASTGLDERAGQFVEDGRLRPSPVGGVRGALAGMFGGVWEWTRSAYEPYPGYVVPEGAIGEYNGKFMINQQVLRGGSCVTPRSHVRRTYRNFFYPWMRWQFGGIRLARDA